MKKKFILLGVKRNKEIFSLIFILVLAFVSSVKAQDYVTVVANRNYLFEKIFKKDLFAIANSVDEIEQIYIKDWLITRVLTAALIKIEYIPGLSDLQKVAIQDYIESLLELQWYVEYVEPNYLLWPPEDPPPPWPFVIGELFVELNGASKEYDANELYYPTAFFTHSPHLLRVNETVTLNATPSLSGWNGTHDMPIVSYAWNFGDGTPVVIEADPIVTHNYTAEDTYTITLNITDSQGLWNTTSQTITMNLAEFSLVTMYEVHLDLDYLFGTGANLTILFYTYAAAYQGNITVWTGETPTRVMFSITITHPQGKPVEMVKLVLTDNFGNVIQTVKSYAIRRSDLMARLGELDHLIIVPGADRSAIMKEYVAIDGQWPYAPT